MNKILLFCSLGLFVMFGAFAADTCPSGYVQLNKPNYIISLTDSCPTGYALVGGENPVVNCTDTTSKVCMFFADFCKTGVTKLKTSTGVVNKLYDTKTTTPSLVVKTSGGLCYGNLASGSAKNAVNIKYNGNVYHVVD